MLVTVASERYPKPRPVGLRVMTIRLGTRGSRLALVQSELVAARLREQGHEVELVPIVTEGDVRPVDMSPGEGVFVAAIARALLAGEVDVAVHSAKDVPLEEEPGLMIAAYPERADPRDVLITRDGGGSLSSLPRGAIVGTDSPRRTGFLLAARPDLKVVPLHGNVETRLKRLDEGAADAIVLAAAGIDRLGRGGRIDEWLEPDVVAPAPGQGALAVQVRRSEARLVELISAIDDRDVRLAVEAERHVLAVTGGTCRAPVGALASVSGDSFNILAAGVNSDGSDRLVQRAEGVRSDATTLAARLGKRLVAEVALR
jgi:hydroxymethylbilane synthase